MIKKFSGRPVFPGNVKERALVTHKGFNALASFYPSLRNNTSDAICADQDNPELFGKNMTGKIICLTVGIGSTSTGSVWDWAASRGITPKALLFSQKIDMLSAAGLAIVEVWQGKRIIAVDKLGDEFLNFVKEGDLIEIEEKGVVIIQRSDNLGIDK